MKNPTLSEYDRMAGDFIEYQSEIHNIHPSEWVKCTPDPEVLAMWAGCEMTDTQLAILGMAVRYRARRMQ